MKHLGFSEGKLLVEEILKLPSAIEKVLGQNANIHLLAQKYSEFSNIIYLGRKYNFPIALEGALKLKEISYIHAEGLSGGELKHGFIALVDETFPTIAIATKDSVYDKMISNLMEIKARKGPILALATEGDTDILDICDDVIFIPKVGCEQIQPIVNNIALQLFAYHCSILKGLDVDKPRNLAKSVTVE
jgi:glucosamine--fructose-6-phosphate aminotransferase (isomerizing)